MKNLNNNELERLWLEKENQILKDENEELKKNINRYAIFNIISYTIIIGTQILSLL